MLFLACPLSSGLGDEKKPAAADEKGLVKVEVQGKLVREAGRYCVQAKNPGFKETFLVELVRTEDKNRDLNEHLRSLEGQVVIVRGVLRYSPRRIDGPELGIPIKSESQVQKAKKG
jgi:hypothetical protein